MANIYIGLMSGTSIDSIDAVALSFDKQQLQLIGSHSHIIPDNLKRDIVALCQPGDDSVELFANTDNRLAKLFAEATLALMEQNNITADQVIAVGSHGQTVRHAAPEPGKIAFSQQIGNPSLIATLTGCAVVADFRRKDMALGGQGAPLVPAFHRQLFTDAEHHRVIVNIGGIANITVLPAGSPEKLEGCIGFDTGPGNLLLDGWCQRHLKTDYDDDGAWGASGSVNVALLNQLKTHPFFGAPAPKSTGRETFNLQWLDEQLGRFAAITAEDVQATLARLTAESIADQVKSLKLKTQQVYVCGGGAFNGALMAQLAKLLPMKVATTASLGLDPNWVEACAFAWLAKQRIELKPGNIPAVTGAKKAAILGGLYLSD